VTKASSIKDVHDLTIAGMRAGFTVEQMIRLLNMGISCELLSEMIEKGLSKDHIIIHEAARS